jgi:hypothetical protein
MTIEVLNTKFPGKILSLPYPKPFPAGEIDATKIKAIVLGCDPSNFSKKDGSTKEIETVFGIEGKGKDKRYFHGILINLELLGLSLENIYVQNLCRNYFTQETTENSIWLQAAKLWAESLGKELHELGIPASVPVLLTSKDLYDVLLKDNARKYTPKELYTDPSLVPVKRHENLLGRNLIPLYRGGGNYYDLKNWHGFTGRILEGFANNFNWKETND